MVIAENQEMFAETKKKKSASMWHAVLVNNKAEYQTVCAKTQSVLKKLVSNFPDSEPILFVRGKSFPFRVQKSFEILKEEVEVQNGA